MLLVYVTALLICLASLGNCDGVCTEENGEAICGEGFNFPLTDVSKGITGLKISSKALKKITREDLEEFTELEVLDLSDSGLETIDENTFKGNKKLIEMNLSRNKDLQIPDNMAFFRSKSLTKLNLTGSINGDLPEEMLTEIKNLAILDISEIKENTADQLVNVLQHAEHLKELFVMKGDQIDKENICDSTSVAEIIFKSYDDENNVQLEIYDCLDSEKSEHISAEKKQESTDENTEDGVSEKKEDTVAEKKEDNVAEKKEDTITEKKEDTIAEKIEDSMVDRTVDEMPLNTEEKQVHDDDVKNIEETKIDKPNEDHPQPEVKKEDDAKKDTDEKPVETMNIPAEKDYKEECNSRKNLQFNGDITCSDGTEGLLCDLQCRDGMVPETPVNNPYTCSFKTGLITPEMIPNCIFGKKPENIKPVIEPDSLDTQNTYNNNEEKPSNISDDVDIQNNTNIQQKSSNIQMQSDQKIGESIANSEKDNDTGISGSNVVLGIIVVIIVIGALGMGYKYWNNHRGYHNTKTEDVEAGDKQMRELQPMNSKTNNVEQND